MRIKRATEDNLPLIQCLWAVYEDQAHKMKHWISLLKIANANRGDNSLKELRRENAELMKALRQRSWQEQAGAPHRSVKNKGGKNSGGKQTGGKGHKGGKSKQGKSAAQDPAVPANPSGLWSFDTIMAKKENRQHFFQDERPDDLLRLPIGKVCKHSVQQGPCLHRLWNLRQSLQLLRLPRVQSGPIELSASTDTEPQSPKFTGFPADFAASSTTICRNEARDSSQSVVVLS